MIESNIPPHTEIRKQATILYWSFRIVGWLALINTCLLMIAIGFYEYVGPFILRVSTIFWLLSIGAYMLILAAINDAVGGMVVKIWKAIGPDLYLEEHQREVVEAARRELGDEESTLP